MKINISSHFFSRQIQSDRSENVVTIVPVAKNTNRKENESSNQLANVQHATQTWETFRLFHRILKRQN